jgi:uncharacterized membrane protein
MTFFSLALVAGGILAIGIGLPASQRCGRLLGTLAALLVLSGVIAALTGSLLWAVPGFFYR